MKEHEYYYIEGRNENGVLASPLLEPGMVTLTGDVTRIDMVPHAAMDLAFMTLCAAQEADPEHWDERWERFKEQVRKAFGE
jgi:hypothetical protein